MYQSEILKNVNSSEWNRDLLQSNYSTFFQCAEFLLPESENQFPIFIYIRDDNGKTKGQLGLIIRKSISGRSGTFFRKTTELASKLGRRGSWVSGPILHSENKKERIIIIRSIIKALEEIIEKYHLTILDGYSPPQDFQIDQNYLGEFTKNGYASEEFLTLITDFENYSLDDLWGNVKKNARNDVSKAQRKNICVKEIENKAELKNYKFLARKWAKTKGIDLTNPLEDLEKDWACIKSGMQCLFLAYRDDIILAGLKIGCFNKIAYTHQVLNSYLEYGGTAGPLLTWSALKWAKQKGMRIYDFSGGKAPPNKQNDKKYSEQWDSLFAYKRKWGGKEFPYYHFIKVKNTQKYKLFRIFAKSDWIYREFKRKRHKRPKKQ